MDKMEPWHHYSLFHQVLEDIDDDLFLAWLAARRLLLLLLGLRPGTVIRSRL